MDKKKIIIGILCALIMIMAVGYGMLMQQLKINGTLSVGSTWRVEITNITEKEKTVGANSKSTPNYTSTTANFNTGFTSPGDYIIYEIEISNLGTLDAIVDSINTTLDNGAIKYTLSGIKEKNKLSARETKKIELKIEYRSDLEKQPSNIISNIELVINFIEAFGSEETTDLTDDITISKAEYIVGDKLTFAGSDWYVIEDSDFNQDYVKLMKETVVNNTELGSYAHSSGKPAIKYNDNYTNTYENSKIREFLEEIYLTKIDPHSNKLKLVELGGKSYKIRLITLNELLNNLGYETTDVATLYEYDESNTPSWVYQNFGEGGYSNYNGIDSYWTMEEYGSSLTYIVPVKRPICVQPVNSGSTGVRPVINLYKSAIE